MSNRHKRKKDFDPTKSDSDDLDYGAESPPHARPSGRSRKSKSSGRKPPKRRRERYGDSDDAISLDEDASSDEGDFNGTSQDEDDEPVERNPKTGRGVRSAAKREVNYEEGSSDGESGIEDTDPEDSRPVKSHRIRDGVPAEKQSLVIKLKVPVKGQSTGPTRSRPASSRGVKREPTPQAHSAAGTRRSSRISHDEQAPLVALTDSGKNEVVTRAGTATPEPQALRPTRGGKGLRNPPSAILEVSHEGTQPSQHEFDAPDLMSQLQEAAAEEAKQEEIGDTQPDVLSDDDADRIQMEVDDEQAAHNSADEHDEDEGPVARGHRTLRSRRNASTPPTSHPQRSSRRSLRARKPACEQSSDFEPDAEAEGEPEDDSMSSDGNAKGRDPSSNGGSQSAGRFAKSGRKTASQRSRSARQPSEDELDPDELADEAAELDEDNRRNRRGKRRPAAQTEIAFEPNLRQRGKKVDYRIIRPDLLPPLEEDDAPTTSIVTPARNRRGGGGGAYRSLFSTFGPFGGAGGPPPVFGGEGALATGGVDSDSSDDETGGRTGQPALGGVVGMTPTSAFPKQFGAPAPSEPLQGQGGGPPGLGKIKDRKALADSDPLGVDPNVSFDGVGGLDDHIDRLKEMVALPLLYPELFQRFHVTPPRGVLFHGPPGTGKTLLARALASSVSSHGKKVTFYMRKGADALSKWVGEAEKQLRLLFEEARKNQPSIIFFDEIDGLAPVRSSKQEQIHASIVATLLALMDGMDGRGQVIVIGATNRPDSVDPALRRPGRFDREFYFPLPDQKARRAIIDIHTKGWEPPLQNPFKDQLAEITRGYGGADLRALCTEAALNAVQGTYPQIYSSNQKLLIDPSTIKVLAKDFMISVNKIVPSSERSASSGATPLRKDVEPLLRKALAEVTTLLDQAIPRKKNITALEQAMYDDREDEKGFERETMQRQFESARVFRPRLLVKGLPGMGQTYLGAALLSKLEGLHVQNFDLATLMKDSTRSPEAAIVQQFEEVKRHKPAVIYIPNIDLWYHTLGDAAIRTFTGLLRSLSPTEPVLLLGIMDRRPFDNDELDSKMIRDLFGYSRNNLYDLARPDNSARYEYFQPIADLIATAPSDFPDPENRTKRILPELPVVAAEEQPQGPSKAELKAQKKKDRQTLNYLKLHIQGVMDQIKLKYKKFRTPAVDEAIIGYLFDEQDPHVLTTDLSEGQRQQQQLFRPYELDKDEKGVAGLREVASGKFFYNLEIVTIEKRLSNGYYKRPRDFLADIKRLAKDAKAMGDQDRTIKANEMLANVEVDMAALEQQHPALVAECEAVFEREQQRERDLQSKAQEAEQNGTAVAKGPSNVPPPDSSKATTESSGPVVLGQQIPGPVSFPAAVSAGRDASSGTTSWSHANGSHNSHAINGSLRHDEDMEMPDSQGDDPEPVRPDNAPAWLATAGTSQANAQGLRSQKSALTQLTWGSQPDQYQNSASTTTSGQRTSDKSARSSDPYSLGSNGVRLEDRPFTDLTVAPGGSQLPNTQEPVEASSQSQASPPSQPMAPPVAPAQRKASVQALLNGPAGEGESSDSKNPSRVIIEHADLRALHEGLAKSTSGFSLEQLEQINAALMDVIWKKRGEWNRDKVIQAVQTAHNEATNDIEQTQGQVPPSQPER